MKNPLNWKHTTHNHKAYGNWDGSKYETPFLDTSDIEEDIEYDDCNL